MNVVGRISLGACAITMAMLVGPSLDAQRGPVVPLVDANHLRMNPEEGLVSTTVFGDPARRATRAVRTITTRIATSR